MKRCSRCRQEKAYTEYHVCAENRDGYRGQCKKCRNEVTNELRKRKRAPVEVIDPWDWIRELAQIKQQQPHSFF